MKIINEISQHPMEYLGSPKNNKKVLCINNRLRDKIFNLI